MKKIIHYLIVLSFNVSLSISYATAQVDDSISDSLYYNIVEKYLSVFTTIESNYEVDIAKFKRLFAEGQVLIDNDFCSDWGYAPPRFTSPGEYINQLIAMFSLRAYKDISGFDIQVILDKGEMLFCREGNIYHIWVNKVIKYRFNGQPRHVDTWVHIKIRYSNREFKIFEILKEPKPTDADSDNVPDIIVGKNKCDLCPGSRTGGGKFVTVNGCINDDEDEDGVLNMFDECKTEKGSARTNGCPDSDGDGVKDLADECDDKKGPGINGGCPISALTISGGAGMAKAFGTAWSGLKLLDPQTFEWTNNSNLAGKGILFHASLEYQFSKLLEIGVGVMNFTNMFDEDRLRINLETFLAKKGIGYNLVSVSSIAYQYNLVFLKLSAGTFTNPMHLVKFEAMAGQAFNGFRKNETIIYIDYQSYEDRLSVLSFKTNPILMFGGSVKYEFWPSFWPVGFGAQIWYLKGTPDFSDQIVTFPNYSQKLQFNSQTMQIAGASVAVQIPLRKGVENYKK